jgi:hypothetical protein
MDIIPSEHPDREEALVVAYTSKQGNYSVSYPMVRINGEVLLNEPIISTEGIDFLFGSIFKEE